LRGKDSQVGQLPECTVSDGLWEERKVVNTQKVNATDKYYQVCTVSDGGLMEGRGKALLRGEDGQVGQLSECTVSDGLWEE
jgi:hypothetical protein